MARRDWSGCRRRPVCSLTCVRSAAARRCRPPTDPAARPPRRPALSAGVARGTGRRAGRGRGRRRAGGPTAGRDEGVQGVKGVRRGPHTPPITPALPLSSLPTPRLGGRHPRALPDGRRGPVVRRASSAALCLVLAVRGLRRDGTARARCRPGRRAPLRGVGRAARAPAPHLASGRVPVQARPPCCASLPRCVRLPSLPGASDVVTAAGPLRAAPRAHRPLLPDPRPPPARPRDARRAVRLW